jgi:hypothetical protein
MRPRDPHHLPEAIKPRTLLRDPDGYGYTTSDHRYRLTPCYTQNTLGGRTARITGWNVERNEAWTPTPNPPAEWKHRLHVSWRLGDLRDLYCTTVDRMPWVVAHMDRGILRVAGSLRDARVWAEEYAGAPLRDMRHAKGATAWDYAFGHPDSDRNTCVSILRADHAHLHGWDATQQPFYPYPELPGERGPRGIAYDEEI